jgi:hypothetical protein
MAAPPGPATVVGALSLHATGIKSNGWTAMCGLLMGQYLMLVWDTPAHMVGGSNLYLTSKRHRFAPVLMRCASLRCTFPG